MGHQIILLGAPLPSSLSWDENAFIDTEHDFQATVGVISTHGSYISGSHWRRLRTASQNLEPSFLRTTADLQSIHRPFPDAAAFFTTADVPPYSISQGQHSTGQSSSIAASIESSEDILKEFYDHSFAVHEDVASSSLLDTVGQQPHLDPLTAVPTPVSPEKTFRNPPRPLHLSDLDDIPNAAYLRSIQPQTMTVNLIVGVMSIPEARSITTGRRWGKEQQSALIEMLVGDETKGGFAITLWLSDNGDGLEMRRQVERLQPGDVVLFSNVALSEFRDRVHGQSLRRGITKVVLLYRDEEVERGGEGRGGGGVYSAAEFDTTGPGNPQRLKVRRVRDWVNDFLRTGNEDRPANIDAAAAPVVRKRKLPVDTP